MSLFLVGAVAAERGTASGPNIRTEKYVKQRTESHGSSAQAFASARRMSAMASASDAARGDTAVDDRGLLSPIRRVEYAEKSRSGRIVGCIRNVR
jgi:hypothetical protein